MKTVKILIVDDNSRFYEPLPFSLKPIMVAMVMMAMLFMLEQRMLIKDDYPLFSCFGVVCILKLLLSRRAAILEEVIRQLE